MPRYAEITLRYTICTDVRYAKLREWADRLHYVTERRLTKVVSSSVVVRTWGEA
jgi:hypothetical protein